jgi:drug/metabolite transporter (DMT)-like permease
VRVDWRWESVAALLFAGIFSSFIAYVLWNRAVAQVGANVASTFMHLGPVFGTALAWLLLGERLHLFHVAGVAAIFAGIVVVTRSRRANVPIKPGVSSMASVTAWCRDSDTPRYYSIRV